MTTTQPTIEQLFDSPIKIRLLKLFLRNPAAIFGVPEAAKKIGSRPQDIKRHLLKLKEVSFLIQKPGKKRKPAFMANQQFLLYPELENLIFKSIPVPFEKLRRQIKSVGNVKLAVIAGIFLNEKGSRLDLLLVGGERMSQAKLNNFVRKTEQNIGKEIVYVVFNSKEFRYRLDVRDRFVRDLLEGRHERLIQRIKL